MARCLRVAGACAGVVSARVLAVVAAREFGGGAAAQGEADAVVVHEVEQARARLLAREVALAQQQQQRHDPPLGSSIGGAVALAIGQAPVAAAHAAGSLLLGPVRVQSPVRDPIAVPGSAHRGGRLRLPPSSTGMRSWSM